MGRIAAAHGLRGEVAVQPLSDVPQRFAPDAELILSRAGERDRSVRVVAVRRHREQLLLTLDGVTDRSGAEALRGGLLSVDERDVPPPPADTYYHFQLEGCRCVDRAAGEIGTVVEVLEGGGGMLLRVEGVRGELLLPFVESYLGEVNVAARRIDWTLPEGFLAAAGWET